MKIPNFLKWPAQFKLMQKSKAGGNCPRVITIPAYFHPLKPFCDWLLQTVHSLLVLAACVRHLCWRLQEYLISWYVTGYTATDHTRLIQIEGLNELFVLLACSRIFSLGQGLTKTKTEHHENWSGQFACTNCGGVRKICWSLLCDIFILSLPPCIAFHPKNYLMSGEEMRALVLWK